MKRMMEELMDTVIVRKNRGAGSLWQTGAEIQQNLQIERKLLYRSYKQNKKRRKIMNMNVKRKRMFQRMYNQ
jgi:hypothetical protein